MPSKSIVTICCGVFIVLLGRLQADEVGGNLLRAQKGKTEEDAVDWLKAYNKQLEEIRYKDAVADWNYSTNITDETSQIKVEVHQETADFRKRMAQIGKSFPYDTFKNKTVKRQFKFLTQLDINALDKNKNERYSSLINEMETIYSKAKICPPNKPDECDLEKEGWALSPDIELFMRTSRNYSQLSYVWEQWREETGNKMIEKYLELRDLINLAALENGFGDGSKMRRDGYVSDLPPDQDFTEILQKLWGELLPLYKLLHGYVRHKLINYYGEEYVMRPEDPIPAHLFGDLWTQSWENIYDIVKPNNKSESVNITDALINQNYDAEKIFRTAEKLFTSINLQAMPESFWNNSMLEKPEGADVVCHASASDFYKNKDVRIKQCTTISSTSFITAHHEMGHCEYYLLYGDLPAIFRRGANPGFHEAVGDTISLSVQTNQYMHKIDLIEDQPENDNNETQINFLMKMALENIASLPFGYLVDLWRWELYTEKVEDEKANQYWWKLREEYQGIIPPVMRDASNFDPGAKYHITADVPYIRYFISRILQFSFYKSACEASGHPQDKPLHQCDFSGSHAAGYKLAQGLKLGRSKPWPEVLEIMTGSKQINASAILEYFKPLEDFLVKYNTDNKLKVGWTTEAYKHWVEPCLDNPCYNEGVCIPADPSFSCKCKTGFVGHRCSTHAPEFDKIAAAVGGLVGGVLLLVLIISGVVFYTTRS